MESELARVSANQHGYFYRRQALDCGYGPKEIAALLRAKEWLPIRRGAYVPRDVWDTADATGRHVLTVRAVVGNLEGQVVVTHTSALAVMRVPMWGIDLRQVHVHRDGDRSGRRVAGVVHHVGALPETAIIEVDGLRVAVGERSLVDAARTVPFEAGVVLADGAMRRPGFDEERAWQILETQRDWAGSVRASRVLGFADARAETVGESRCRVLMARIGVPRPTLQRLIHAADGRLLGISDLYIEEFETAVEFDGRLKYGRALYEKTGRLDDGDIGEVVWAEKQREDAIRDEGNEMVRVIWRELDGHDRSVSGRFSRAFARSRAHRRAV